MRISGLNKLTLVDYPSKMAAIVFFGGCDFRCPFCHNGDLVLHPSSIPEIPQEEVFSFLEKRKGLLDGVVISGGEPTLEPDIAPFISRVKEMGFLVKLDTNGSRPDVLSSLISSSLVDYVAMDVKNSFDRYAETIGFPFYDTRSVRTSLSLLLEENCDYELRTTCVRELHDEESFYKIALDVKGAKRYYLQNFVPNENTIRKGFSPVSREALLKYSEILRNSIGNVSIRDIK